MRSQRVAFASCLLIAVLGLARPAAAAPAAEKAAARQAFAEGTRRYNLGEFDKALDAFKTAYLHVQDPAFLYNIAQCHRALGNKPDALQAYRAFLREATVPEAQRTSVQDIVAQLEASIAADKQAEDDRRAAEAAAAARAAQPAPAATVAVEAAPPPRRTPVYKKWWLWTAVGGVVVAGVAIGLGVGLTRTPSSPATPGGYQTLQPSF